MLVFQTFTVEHDLSSCSIQLEHSSSLRFRKYSQYYCFTNTNVTAACISDTVGDVATIVAAPTGYFFIQVFYNATLSKGSGTTMWSIMIVLPTTNGMTNMATLSRQLFAFARDRGVPFSDWFQRVPTGWISHSLVSISLLYDQL